MKIRPPLILGIFVAITAIPLFTGYGDAEAFYVKYAFLKIVFYWGLVLAFAYCMLSLVITVYRYVFGKRYLMKAVVAKVKFVGNETAVDLGAGTGSFATELAKRIPKGRVIGIDTESHLHVTTAESIAKREGVSGKVSFEIADPTNLPFDDATIDLVVTSFFLHRQKAEEDRAKTLREIDRILKPGAGVIIIDDMHLGEYQRCFKKMGWEKVTATHWLWMIIPPTKMLFAVKPNPEETKNS